MKNKYNVLTIILYIISMVLINILLNSNANSFIDELDFIIECLFICIPYLTYRVIKLNRKSNIYLVIRDIMIILSGALIVFLIRFSNITFDLNIFTNNIDILINILIWTNIINYIMKCISKEYNKNMIDIIANIFMIILFSLYLILYGKYACYVFVVNSTSIIYLLLITIISKFKINKKV